MEVKGVNGQLRLDGDEIVISRKGLLGLVSQGLKGDKSILTAHISSIQFKPAGMLTNGYIQFAFLGGKELKAGLLDATSDENTVIFKASQQKAFEAFRDTVKAKMAEARRPAPAMAQASEADELEKLAGLLDRGVLTQDEFAAKKRQILGL